MESEGSGNSNGASDFSRRVPSSSALPHSGETSQRPCRKGFAKPIMDAFAFVDLADYASSNSQGDLMSRLTMAVTAILLATPAVSRAAGFYLYELGTPSVGLASAG